jgi:hypothetical protein
MASERVVILRGNPLIKSAPLKTGQTVTPGHLVDPYTDTAGLKVHSTAAGDNFRCFAVEQDYTGYGIDDNYATAGQEVRYCHARPGDEINALVLNGTAAIAKGARVMSNGDGTLKTYVAQGPTNGSAITVTPEMIVGCALEAVDNSGGSAPARIAIVVQ